MSIGKTKNRIGEPQIGNGAFESFSRANISREEEIGEGYFSRNRRIRE